MAGLGCFLPDFGHLKKQLLALKIEQLNKSQWNFGFSNRFLIGGKNDNAIEKINGKNTVSGFLEIVYIIGLFISHFSYTFSIKSPLPLPEKCPAILQKMEFALMNDHLEDSVVEQYLVCLREEWMNKVLPHMKLLLEPTWAVCMVGSYASLFVCPSVLTRPKISNLAKIQKIKYKIH